MYSLMWYFVVAVAFFQESYVDSTQSHPYALLKPKTGCPRGWILDKAWVFQDTKLQWSNKRSRILHIDGYVARNYVVRSFCMNKENGGSSNWPQGQYCIYGNIGDSIGSIQMIGEHDKNKDAVKYTGSFVEYLDGTDRQGIKFYFACRTNGNKKHPISLLITKPFYLLPYGSPACQQVQWMVATSEWIKYQTKPYMNGTLPYYKYQEDKKGIKMFYCYYQSCNYTLNNTGGVFKSPGFPGQYPDGQLCSWRIIVSDNHTLRLRFTHFSLSAKDTLKYSKRINGSYSSWYTIPNYTMVPFELSSNSNTVFIFRSDESNSSTGFRAQYRVFMSDDPAATSSATSSIPLTTPRSKSNEDTTKKTSVTSKGEDTQTTTKAINSKSTITANSYTSTIKPKQTKSVEESFIPTNCTTGERVKQSLTKSSERNGKLVVIVIPLACLLLVIILVIDIVYRCRSKTKNIRKSASETSSVDQLPLVVNPTYDSGAIILNQPNDTTIPTTLMSVENGPKMTNQPLTDRPPDYEDIENWKPSKTAPNMEHTIPGCNGSNSETTTEETNKISENPVYESAMTSPPFAEANKLYESVKMDQGKAKN